MEADEIASKIAQAEADEQTKSAAIFYCLIATIDGFPPELFSNTRRFIDCIDVEDVITDTPMSSSSSSISMSSSSLHCSLLLFDDKVVIVKRPNGEKGARSLSGLDGVDKVTKAGGIPTGKKKSGMTCKGVVDITEVAATDIGGAGKCPFSLFPVTSQQSARNQSVPGKSPPGSDRQMVRPAFPFLICCEPAYAFQS
jgi:hypothetical protein